MNKIIFVHSIPSCLHAEASAQAWIPAFAGMTEEENKKNDEVHPVIFNF